MDTYTFLFFVTKSHLCEADDERTIFPSARNYLAGLPRFTVFGVGFFVWLVFGGTEV